MRSNPGPAVVRKIENDGYEPDRIEVTKMGGEFRGQWFVLGDAYRSGELFHVVGTVRRDGTIEVSYDAPSDPFEGLTPAPKVVSVFGDVLTA